MAWPTWTPVAPEPTGTPAPFGEIICLIFISLWLLFVLIILLLLCCCCVVATITAVVVVAFAADVVEKCQVHP